MCPGGKPPSGSFYIGSHNPDYPRIRCLPRFLDRDPHTAIHSLSHAPDEVSPKAAKRVPIRGMS
jgi:hypothetical protein